MEMERKEHTDGRTIAKEMMRNIYDMYSHQAIEDVGSDSQMIIR